MIHFPEQDITVLWDKKTMMHVKVGPQWKVSSSINPRFCVDSLYCQCDLLLNNGGSLFLKTSFPSGTTVYCGVQFLAFTR